MTEPTAMQSVKLDVYLFIAYWLIVTSFKVDAAAPCEAFCGRI